MDKRMFWSEFKKETDILEKEKMSDYKDSDKWTEIIMSKLKNIIELDTEKEIAADDNTLEAQKEYFRIDLIGYKNRKKEIDKCELNPHLWDLDITIEHENNYKDWSDELIKLMYIRCPLKVIISYRTFNQRDKDLEILNTDAKLMMEKTKVFEEFRKSSETLLIVLGNRGNEQGYNSFDYRCYEYNKENKLFEVFK